MTVPAMRPSASATKTIAWGVWRSLHTPSRSSVAPGVASASRQTARIWSTSSRRARRMVMPSATLDPELGIKDVAQPVPHQVHAEGREGEGGAGAGGEPPRHVEEVAALREHAAPRGSRRLHAEAEEGDGRLRHDELRELEAGHDDDGGRHVGQDVAEEDTGPARAERGRGLHVVPLLDGEDLPAHHASIDHPACRREAHDDVAQPQAHDGVNGKREQDEGKGELHVAEAHERLPGPASEEAGEKTQEAAHDHREQHGAEADEERHPCAIENSGERVAPELIRAEEVAGRARRLEALSEVAL